MDQGILNKWILGNLPFHGDVVIAEEIDVFLEDEDFNSVLLFTDENDVASEFAALTSHFRERANFGMVHNDETSLVKRFKISKFPTLVVVTKDGEQVT